MATKAQKNDKIAEIKETIANAKVAVVADYRGLTVAQITDLRRKLQEEKGNLTVVKNTLAKKALEGTNFESLSEFLQGPTAIAFGYGDEVSPARILSKFAKTNDKVKLRGGSLDGKPLDAKQVDELAKLPSKEELIAKMLGSINSPATGLVGCVQGVMRGLVIAMDGVRKQKENV
ncbi:MAG: 50S ribosomal protein L10 [Candidatus Gastranaerophilaceae bacterium]|jgi:large subunit ribosomal protein L10